MPAVPCRFILGKPIGRDGGQSGRPERRAQPAASARALQSQPFLNLTDKGYRHTPSIWIHSTFPPGYYGDRAPSAMLQCNKSGVRSVARMTARSIPGIVLRPLLLLLFGSLLVVVLVLAAIVLAAVGGKGVGEAGAGGQHPPAPGFLPERHPRPAPGHPL